jgi:hypothetical protein
MGNVTNLVERSAASECLWFLHPKNLASNEDQLEKGRRIRNPINQGSKVTFLGEENHSSTEANI